MIKFAFIPIAWVLAGIGAIPGAAMAQVASSSSYTSFGVAQGATVQLGYYASANNNCTPARPPTIRVIETPRSGVLTVRPGELTTDRIAGCLSVKTPAQIVSYEARSDDTDTDHLIYEVTSFNGEVETFRITIHVKEGPKRGVIRSGEHRT